MSIRARLAAWHLAWLHSHAKVVVVSACRLRELISLYQQCVANTVQRFGGFVAKYMGDGVLVYFGYPHAHEDDAEHAVRA